MFLGNVAILRCFISEHARKYVAVLSWLRGDEELHAEMADIGKLKSHQFKLFDIYFGSLSFKHIRAG